LTLRSLVFHHYVSNENARWCCIFVTDHAQLGLAWYASGDRDVLPRESPFLGHPSDNGSIWSRQSLPFAVAQSMLPCSAKVVLSWRGGACHLRLAMLLPKKTFFRLIATMSISPEDTHIQINVIIFSLPDDRPLLHCQRCLSASCKTQSQFLYLQGYSLTR